jgi:hypothetical protein
MSRNKCLSHVRISYVLCFIFIFYLFTVPPSYKYSKELIIKCSSSLHNLILLRQNVTYNYVKEIFGPDWDNVTEMHVRLLLRRIRFNLEFRREKYVSG